MWRVDGWSGLVGWGEMAEFGLHGIVGERCGIRDPQGLGNSGRSSPCILLVSTDPTA